MIIESAVKPVFCGVDEILIHELNVVKRIVKKYF